MTDAAPGALIAGRYRVEAHLGRGGSAEVYRVRDLDSARTVALKRLVAASANRPALGVRFEREFHTLKQLRHPNIVRAYDFGHDDGTAFYTMELLRGDDLRHAVPMPWQRACDVLSDLASALALIHSRRLIHGDVSARNVRSHRGPCDDRATRRTTRRTTLIDFGTMSSIGAPGALVGTPPHMAPELGTGQPVDERTDLYALGTLAYWLLCGRHAYPVRDLAELAKAWQSRPAPLPGSARIPRPLSHLVESLVDPDPVARPRSAAEVLDRLTAISGQPARDDPATARAYLATPTLVQRKPQLERIAGVLDEAAAGRGGALAIEAEAGLGASRLLRELVLRAQTRGALVLSATAGREAGAFSVARSLARQLAEAGCARAARGASTHRGVLGDLAVELGDSTRLAEAPLERRAQIADALSNWFATMARDQLIAIAVADLHRCDDASVGFLSALAAGSSGSRLLVAATIDRARASDGTLQPRDRAALDAYRDGAPHPALLERFCRQSERVVLAPLDRRGTRALAESVFGRVPHIERLAEITHDLCQGNPLLSLELGRYLVDRDLVRYREGAWQIPQDLAVRDLPSTLDAWFRSRVAALDGDARQLADVLAVRGAPTTLDDCVALAAAPKSQVFAALDRLTMTRIAVVSGVKVSLAQDGLRRALLDSLSDERATTLNGRVGKALLDRGVDSDQARLEAGYHLLRGGLPAQGADLIADAATDTALSFATSGGQLVRALEAALAKYDRSGREPGRRLSILVALVRCAFLFDPALTRYAGRTLAALRRDAGLALADVLSREQPGVPREQLLQQALMTAVQRHATLAPEKRGLAPMEAVRKLLLTAFSLMGVGINQLDVAAVERVVDVVEPLAELGIPPAVAAHRLLASVVDAMQGRQVKAQAERLAFIDALSDPTMFAGVSEDRRRSLIAAQLHGIGMLESLRGGDRGLRRADELDAMGLQAFAPAAMQIRVLTHLFNGDAARAEACRAELDILALRHAPAWQLDTWILPYLAGPYDLWGDVIGLKHAVAQLRSAAASYPGFEPFYRFALGAYHRERDELPRALAELETALRLAPAGQHGAWAPAIAAYVHTLVRAGQFARAIDEGEQAMARSIREGLSETWVCGRVQPQLALARARLGDTDCAASRLDEFLRAAEGDGLPRPMLGKAYEARAEVARLAGDGPGFAAAARRAGDCFRATGNPLLIASWDRLAKTGTATRAPTGSAPSVESDIATI